MGVDLQTPSDQTPQRPPPDVGLETPQARPLNFPTGCGPGDPPRPDPSTSPLGMGLETYKACWDTTYTACWDTIPPFREKND